MSKNVGIGTVGVGTTPNTQSVTPPKPSKPNVGIGTGTVGIGTGPVGIGTGPISQSVTPSKPSVGVGTSKPNVGVGSSPTTQSYNSQSKK